MKKYTLLFLFFLSLTIAVSQPVKIAIISDLHYLSSEIAQPSTALEKYEFISGRNISDLHAVLHKTLAEIEDSKVDILLITGDITNHGERQSHIDFIEKIYPLQQRGMKIFVIPGNHDINIPNTKAYIGNVPTPTQSISAEEFRELYKPFGYGNALKYDTLSLSYLAEINKNTWLLCFDTNRYAEHKSTSISGGRILPSTMDWALNILDEAKAKDITVLGMLHHGIMEHLPYQATFFPNHLLENWKFVAKTLADAGLQIVFTGHFHSSDISKLTTSAGNTIYDIETGSLSQYPFPYRLITLDSTLLSINTHFIKSISETTDLQEKYRKISESIIRRGIKSRLQQIEIPIADDAREALIELLVRINILHLKGDEVLDDSMLRSIKQFAEIMGSEDFDIESFQLDFPPADNQLTISLRNTVSNKD
ncbi:MAG: metallophosphoesterase [Bacteroidia bacterium]|nr:metallophosphoesterase [Bacteroidia bacterium]